MRPPKTQDATFNLRLTSKELAALHRVSRAEGVSAAALLRRLFAEHVDRRRAARPSVAKVNP